MTALGVLIPLSILMGIVGLVTFLWTLYARQYEDLKGAAARILLEDDDNDEPLARGNVPIQGLRMRNDQGRSE
ncbi:cbb3-type cytochrome oxidase assembly protein CcoS [Shinella zoogloeoides]